ncbi:MAG: hypothetical protein IB618_03820 [Candidatus Pacearchaeota archaeon]|nr:MAG: hypothetical protein IB618_03820 [Candidatus Pacearchaeota archaeon]
MQPLKSKAGKEAKKKRSQLIIGLFIVFLMVFSVVGYAFLSGTKPEQQGQETYNSYVFIDTPEGWKTQISIESKSYTITTAFLPQELENITIQGTPLLNAFKGKTVYIIANNLSERQAAISLYSNLNKIVFRMQLACSEEESETEFCLENELPIKSCDDATLEITIVEIKETENEPIVNYKNNCLIIEGKGTDLVRATEKSVFIIFGIMEK